MWNHRNQIVHGSTGEEMATRIMNELHDQVRQHYQHFHNDPPYVLAWHQTLFTRCTIDQRLLHTYDHLRCWLRSVEEARHLLAFQECQQQESSARFRSFFLLPHDSTHDSTYTPSSTMEDDTLASFPCTDSTASLTSMSSQDSYYDEDSTSMLSYDSQTLLSTSSTNSQLSPSSSSALQPRINNHVDDSVFRQMPGDETLHSHNMSSCILGYHYCKLVIMLRKPYPGQDEVMWCTWGGSPLRDTHLK